MGKRTKIQMGNIKETKQDLHDTKILQKGILLGRQETLSEVKKAIFQKYDCGVHYERLCKIINGLGNKK